MVPTLGLLASLLLWQLAAQRDAEETEARFHEAAQHMTWLVQERMLRALDLVASFHGLLAVSEPVSRVQFRHQAETLGLPDRFPGFVAVQFSPLVAAPERAAFEASVHAEAVTRPPAHHAFAPMPLALLFGGCFTTLMSWWLLKAVQRHHESTARVAARLAYAAQHDVLTGLPNRLLLDQRLEKALAGAAGHSVGWRCCSSISTASSRSMTGWGMRRAIRCCGDWRGG